MEKRSNTRRVREFNYVTPPTKEEDTGQSPPKTVRLVCVLGIGTYKINGPVTGNRYSFVGNTPLEVDEKDAVILLQKTKGCCGSPLRPIFAKV